MLVENIDEKRVIKGKGGSGREGKEEDMEGWETRGRKREGR